jgi:hypothetical protein
MSDSSLSADAEQPTAETERGRGNELFRSKHFDAAYEAYTSALHLLLLPGDDVEDADSRMELRIACHANRAACQLALAERDDARASGGGGAGLQAGEEGESQRTGAEEDLLLLPWQPSSCGAPYGWSDMDGGAMGAEKYERICVCVASWGAQVAQLDALRTEPWPGAAADAPVAAGPATVDSGCCGLALVLDGAAAPIEDWQDLARAALESSAVVAQGRGGGGAGAPPVCAVFIVGPSNVLSCPPPEGWEPADGGGGGGGGEAEQELGALPVPVVCVRRDEGAVFLAGAVAGCRLSIPEQPRSRYQRVVADCDAALALCEGRHPKWVAAAAAHSQPVQSAYPLCPAGWPNSGGRVVSARPRSAPVPPNSFFDRCKTAHTQGAGAAWSSKGGARPVC